MDEKKLVVQHNKLVEARYKLTIEEQRLIKTLVAQIQPDDEDFKVYEIHVIDLARLIGLTDDYYYSKIKNLTKRLRDSSITFINESGDEVQTGWLSSAIYRKGKGSVQLRFDPVLKPYLLQLRQLFTSYELGNILRLKGIYSIRIYELLKQYQKIGAREFDIRTLRQILQIESEYQLYNDFKRYIIVPSSKEISEKTDISCTFSERRVGRKVVGLIFDIKHNNKVLAKLDADNKELISNAAKEKPESLLLEKLVSVGITKLTAQKIVQDHDEKRIEAAIAYCESQLKEGKIKNPGGFIVEAIKNEYRDNKAEEKEKKQKAKKAVEDKDRQEKERHQKQALQKKDAVETYLRSLTKDQFFALEAEFVEAHKSNATVMRKYNKDGLKSPLVNGCFGEFVFNRLPGFREATV